MCQKDCDDESIVAASFSPPTWADKDKDKDKDDKVLLLPHSKNSHLIPGQIQRCQGGSPFTDRLERVHVRHNLSRIAMMSLSDHHDKKLQLLVKRQCNLNNSFAQLVNMMPKRMIRTT